MTLEGGPRAGARPDDAALRVRAVVDVPVDDLVPVGEGTRRSVAEDLRYVYGEGQPTDWLDAGPGRDYPTMIRAARAALTERGLLDDVRLVLLVVTTPDLQHERLLGGFVADLFDGRPYTFCVTEQGLAGPFTALRLAHEELRHGGPAGTGLGGSALVLVLEQCTLPPAPVRVPARDRVVALVVGHDGPGRPVEALSVARAPRGARPAAPAADAAPGAVLAADAEPGVAPDARRVVLGVDVDASAVTALDGEVVLRADAGAASTGVWEVLAAHDDAAPGASVVLHERCVELGYRCSLALGPRTVREASPGAADRAREAVLA